MEKYIHKGKLIKDKISNLCTKQKSNVGAKQTKITNKTKKFNFVKFMKSNSNT